MRRCMRVLPLEQGGPGAGGERGRSWILVLAPAVVSKPRDGAVGKHVSLEEAYNGKQGACLTCRISTSQSPIVLGQILILNHHQPPEMLSELSIYCFHMLPSHKPTLSCLTHQGPERNRTACV